MKTTMLGLLAESQIHPGTGRDMGVVDLPVAREASTDYPVLVGSSLKGSLRDKARNKDGIDERHFGKPDVAGDLLVSDGRLLLLPVRSLTTSYRWITCPHILERYSRDLVRAGSSSRLSIPEIKPGSIFTDGKGSMILEERQFSVDGGTDQELQDLANAIKPLILHEDTAKRLNSTIAVLHDDDFTWFARYSLSVQARNVLDEDTKKSKNLWYEETLPSDTVMYALVMTRNDEAANVLDALFSEDDPYLQAGGNETVGQGWFAVRKYSADAGEVK